MATGLTITVTHDNSLNMSACFAVTDYKMFVFINNRIKMPTAAYFLMLGPTQRVDLSWCFETDWMTFQQYSREKDRGLLIH